MLFAAPAGAHGVAGNRLFPATLAIDDPAVGDELTLPSVAVFPTGDDPAATETDISGEFDKRITKQFHISVGETWTHLSEPDGPPQSGFQNFDTGLKYQFVTSEEHEAIVSAGLHVEWGGTGSSAVGADKITTVTPTIYFGKGLGDLPESASWARPLAVTGVVAYAIPTKGDGSRILRSGFTVQYSLPYLTQHVRDTDWPDFFKHLIPLVEVALNTPVTNAQGAPTTGTVNPGVIWTGQHFQVGVEAIVPINRVSGKGVGGVASLDFFLDDLLPHSIGKPIW
ncbi:MAG TPA: hypothetical protein VII63_03525 [Caulobacteraceae bacterium]